MAGSSASVQERSQYHHFIPRFILRNYSHPGESPTGPRTSKKRGKRKNGPCSTEPMLYGINLAGEEPEITETSVAKTFGMIDMYRDLSASTRQHQIEQQLSVLESRAGEIISTIRKAFEAGKADVWITRTQRDTLRKFLFIMKYRSRTFHRRYCHDNSDDYDADDREKMLKYMKETGIKKPIDVWFDNIKGILDLKMDYRMEWIEKIQKRIYPDDAKWFISNVQGFYMALITPTNTDDEFLLTQNAYSIHEGASSERLNPVTRKMELSAYTEFHVFAPIAPRLLIVLRNFILPVPEEDFDDTIREHREMFYKASVDGHPRPEEARLSLRDLPISKALNSYSKIIDGRLVPINGGPTGANDKFGFRFFSTPEEYVNKINGIMLEESHRIDLIVFNNKSTTYKTLEHYLASRSEFDIDSSRLRAIKKLNLAAKLLATTIPTQDIPDPWPNPSREEVPADKVHALFIQDNKAKELYFELSGKALDSKDFDQACGLLYMRIKLDSSTRGLPTETREAKRNRFLEVYDQFPVQVVWIYLKRIRFMKLGGTMIGIQNTLEDYVLPAQHLHGLEDVVAASKPIWGLISELTLDDDGLKRLHEEKELVLGTQGSICDCGIPKIEEAAKAMREIVKDNWQKMWKSPLDPIFSEDEKIELLTRDLVRGYNDEGTGKRLVENLELEKVLFDVVYPLFGSRSIAQVGEGADEGWSCLVQ
ncbi:uncharacterized protein PAC_10601 [Phialocephala subalpina]|uniref:DUF4238 domain-containing protein n=1 Tax=Phialocephala subalpina TaxID=576137 RepID=A0A1L7X6Q5_9HELO|nr:uncharacterized protein PAC_10601 [Phialocephala subalpina]